MWSNDLQQRCQEYTVGKKDILFNRWGWENWISIGQRMKLGPYFTLHIKFNSKWMKDLNIKPETIKLLEKKTVGQLHDIGFGNAWHQKYRQQKRTDTREQTDLKNFGIAKEQPTE